MRKECSKLCAPEQELPRAGLGHLSWCLALVGLVPAVTIIYTALPRTGLFQGPCVNDQTFFHNNLAERWG